MKFGKNIHSYIINITKSDLLKKYNINLIKSVIKYKVLKNYLKRIKISNNEYITDDCAICLETLNINHITTICNHKYHPYCFINILSKGTRCPICREDIIEKLKNHVHENMTNIITFLCMLRINIDFINKTYNQLNQIINDIVKNNKKPFYCCSKNNIEFNEMLDIFEDFKYFNYNGIRKILKKFKKISNIDCNDFLNFLNFISNE